MKLAKIYRRHTLITLALVIMTGGFLSYNIFIYFVHQSDHHTLMEFKQNLDKDIRERNKLPGNNTLSKGRITHKLVSPDVKIEPVFSDTVVYSTYKKEHVSYRILTYTQDTPQGNAIITLWQTSMDTDDVASAITISLITFFALYILFSVWWYKWFMRRLWLPFYRILRQLNRVDMTDRNMISINQCNIDEFNELVKVVNRMLTRINDDYTTLQGLTETTSHELQTPLSVIKAKIEMMQQDSNNSKKQSEQIKILEKSVDRLIRLNRFLLTIARINNNQFSAANPVSLKRYIDEFLESYADFIEIKGLVVTQHYDADFVLSLHPQLAEILVSNLLSNAIRYNVKGGSVEIYITCNTLKVVNTYGNTIPSGNLLARFNKSVGEKDSIGLGLSIVDSICKKNDLHISIEVTDTEFAIEIKQVKSLTT